MPKKINRIVIISKDSEEALNKILINSDTEQVFALFGDIDKSVQTEQLIYVDAFQQLVNNIEKVDKTKSARENFRIDLTQIISQEQIDKNGFELIGFAHSHPNQEKLEWSESDIKYFTNPKSDAKKEAFLGKVQLLFMNGRDIKEGTGALFVKGSTALNGVENCPVVFESEVMDMEEPKKEEEPRMPF